MKLKDKNRYGNIKWTSTGKAVLWITGFVLFFALFNISAVIRSDFRRGIPTTYEGKVVYISYEHNKWQNFDWTLVEMQITIEDVKTIYLWGHVELDVGSYYEIETIRHIERGQRFPWSMQPYDEVVGARNYDG